MIKKNFIDDAWYVITKAIRIDCGTLYSAYNEQTVCIVIPSGEVFTNAQLNKAKQALTLNNWTN